MNMDDAGFKLKKETRRNLLTKNGKKETNTSQKFPT